MPDVYAIWDGLPLWLELKVINTDKVRLSPQQIAWHTSHSHVGGLSFILVKHLGPRALFLFEGHRAREISSEGLGSGADFECSGFGDLFGAIKDRVSGHYREKFGDSGI
jgi:Holliday junction resolvase